MKANQVSKKWSKNFQVIYVMWLREMKRFWRSKSRVIGSLAMPFFFLLVMGSGFRNGFNIPGIPQGVNYLDFLVPAMVGMTILFNSMFAGLSILWDKEFGFLKEIMVAPVGRTVIVLGRIVGGLATAMIQGILILFVSLFLGFKLLNPWGILMAIIFMILIGAGFIGFGVAIASCMEDTQGFSLIMQFIVMPIFLLSGAFFPIANFPKWLRPLAYIDPLTYGIDGLRQSLLGFGQFSAWLDAGLLLLFALMMVILGTLLFNQTEV